MFLALVALQTEFGGPDSRCRLDTHPTRVFAGSKDAVSSGDPRKLLDSRPPNHAALNWEIGTIDMLATIPMQVPSLVIAPCRHGTFAFHQTDLIGRMLLTYGEWAEQEIGFLSSLLRPGDTVIDIGAHIGTISIPLAKAVGPTGKVFSFEAQRLVFYNLCTNITLNGLDNIQALNAVVSNENGFIALRERNMAEAKNSGGYSIPIDATSPLSEYVIQKIALDDFFRETKSCRLIKMDIEGHEPAALSGMEFFLRRTQPILYIEANTRGRFEQIHAILDRLHYIPFWHCKPHFNPDNFRKTQANFYQDQTDINLICFPPQHTDIPSDLSLASDFAAMERFAGRP